MLWYTHFWVDEKLRNRLHLQEQYISKLLHIFRSLADLKIEHFTALVRTLGMSECGIYAAYLGETF